MKVKLDALYDGRRKAGEEKRSESKHREWMEFAEVSFENGIW